MELPGHLAELRQQIARMERSVSRRLAAIPLGPAIDAHLPAGGLALGALHEAAGGGADSEDGAAAALFAAGVLARTEGPVIWALIRPDLFAPALDAVGLHPDRVIFAHAGTSESVLMAMEEALREPGLGGVVGEIEGRLGLTASRRLQLAAEVSCTLGIALRRSRRQDDPSTRRAPCSPAGGSPRCRPPRRCCTRPRCPAWGGRAGSWNCGGRAGRRRGPGSWGKGRPRAAPFFLPPGAPNGFRARTADARADAPLVTAAHDGRRRVVAGADRAARALGIRPGLP